MNKKFISAFMLGLLTLGATSTITSCKDYDGDISNLQGQIDKLASKEELASKIAELQGQISAAKTEASNALTAAKAAQATADTKADKADLQALQTKVSELAAEVAKKADKSELEALQTLVAEKADKAEVEKAIKALQDKDAEIAQALADAIEAQKLIDGGQDSKITEALEAAKKNADAIVALEKDLTEDLAQQEERIKALESSMKATQEALGNVETLVAEIKNTKADKATVDALADLVGAEAVSVQIEKANAALMTNLYTQEQVKALISQIELKLMEAYSTMVTAVDLYSNGHMSDQEDGHNYYGQYDAGHMLTFYAAEELANEFGKGMVPDAEVIKTVKGNFVTTPASVTVRVSPASAILKAENVGLVNSQGANLDEYLDVEVKPYTELLSRSTTPTGLWTVSYKLKKDYDAEGFAKAVKVQEGDYKNRNVLFAVSVKNDNEKVQAGRVVVSEFDLTAQAAPAEGLKSELFTVNDVCIDLIKNRSNGSAPEYVWDVTGKTNVPAIPAVKPTIKIESNVFKPLKSNVSYGDDRTAGKYIKVDVDEPIVIDFSNENCYHGDQDIRGFYVTLDYGFVEKESAPSELNAWNNYVYENVGMINADGTTRVAAHMFTDKTGTIKISSLSENVTSDVIGFRVYAVNQNGTLVDPDGTAFYVEVGKSAAEDMVVNGTIKVKSSISDQNFVVLPLADAYKKLTFDNQTIPSNYYPAEEDADGVKPWFRLEFFEDANCATPNSLKSKIANYVKVSFASDVNQYIDDDTYTIKVPLTNSTIANSHVADLVINVKKEMPTSCTITTRTGMVSPFNAFLYPEKYSVETLNYDANFNVTGAEKANIKFEDFFNVDYTKNPNYIFTLANVVKDGNKGYVKSKATNGSYVIEVEGAAIDLKEHTIDVKYNYGAVSKNKTEISGENVTKSDNGYYVHTSNYTVPAEQSYQATLSHYGLTSTYKWYTDAAKKIYAPELLWKVEKAGTDYTYTIDFNEKLDITNSYSKELYGGLLKTQYMKYRVIDAKLENCDQFEITNVDNTVHENKIVITQTEKKHKPAEYTAKLAIKILDVFGHIQDVTLDLPVKIQD